MPYLRPLPDARPLDVSRVRANLKRLRNLPLLVVGDLLCDRYIYGNTSRISREAPVPVVHTKREEIRPGGAANVAMNLRPFGVRVHLMGAVGRDGYGTRLLSCLRQGGVSVAVVRASARPTSVKARVIAEQHQQVLRLDTETAAPLGPPEEARLWRKIQQALPRVRGVILSDYGKGILTESLLRRVFSAAGRRGLPVVVDPRGRSFKKYRGAAALLPNAAEAERATGAACETREDALRAARRIMRDTGARSVLVTLGPRGMLLCEKGRRGVRHIPARAKEVYDVTGAGDTVSALFGALLASGATACDAAWTANVAAGVVVEKFGTATTSPEEILKTLAGASLDAADKAVLLRSAARLGKTLRAQGRRVVFTNGCFDLLHPGHVQVLSEARTHGDILVVGLNSDTSVRRLKGPKRPLVPQGERLRMLAALACVDYVIVFSEPTPRRLIRALRPDVLVKGGDYRGRRNAIVGSRDVASWGGKTVVAGYKKGCSSSALMKKIAGIYRA
jgi:D-beta-D-heptose 7-phosphate kinase/D-beta-D-heptose 1-phosphate adenosyltransferase